MGSLLVCVVLYIAVCLVITGMVPYTLLGEDAPLAEAFTSKGLKGCCWTYHNSSGWSVCSAAGLERKDFGLVLGLVHFICMKLTKQEHSIWEQLPMMMAYVTDLFPPIEREMEKLAEEVNENGKQTLVSARELLESVMMYSMKESEGGSTMEE